MGPRPHSERSSLPNESSNNISAEIIPTQLVAESPSPPTLSPATTPSPVPQEIIILESHAENVDIQEDAATTDVSTIPYYPTPEDIMPYDHTLPDFIRQMTNQPNLANLHSLSLKVISRLVSLQRMSMYTPNLRELDLEGSMLSSLRDIGCNLKYLQVLKVGRCQLDSLDGTFGLTSLRELYAQKNQITDVSPCSNLPHIRHIDVSQNRIRNVSYAGFLSMCYKLRSIAFTGNPATEVPGYREHVRRILPQVEVLDNVPFLNDDNRNNTGRSELIENCVDNTANNSSAEDSTSLLHKSPDSMNNFFEPDEDPYSLSKFNAPGTSNQEKYEATDYEVQEVLAMGDIKNDLDRLNLRKNEQKSSSNQRIDEGMENSKRSNHQSSFDLDEDDEEFVHNDDSASLDGVIDLPENDSEPSGSYLNSSPVLQYTDSGENSYELEGPPSNDKEKKPKKDIKRPSTANVVNYKSNSPESAEKSGAVKKRPSTAAPRLILRDEDDEQEQSAIETGASKLTTGMPVCGNITAALRHRRKHQTAWAEEKEIVKTKKTKPLILMPKEKKELDLHLGASGDSTDLNSSDEIKEVSPGEDVLATSKKWREAFLKFRSSNRARWEEEDEMDYSNILGGLEEETANESFESDEVYEDK